MSSLHPSLPVESGPAYAGFGRRLGAYLLDATIAFSVLGAVVLTLQFLRASGFLTPREDVPLEETFAALGFGAKLAIFVAYALSGGAIYKIVFEASSWQATLGKRLLNIYVTDDAGRRIQLGQSSLRWLVLWLASFACGSLISVITVLSSEQHKALHDMPSAPS